MYVDIVTSKKFHLNKHFFSMMQAEATINNPSWINNDVQQSIERRQRA